MSERKFILAKEPFIRKADNRQSTTVIMRDYLISLLPLILFAWFKNGILPFSKGYGTLYQMLFPLIFILLGGIFSFLIEFIYYFVKFKNKNFKDTIKKTRLQLENSYASIPGLLLAMILTVNTPIWVLLIGCIIATLLAKLLFGGFGHNIFNPALIGYLIVGVAYIALLNHPTYGYYNPGEYAEYINQVGGIVAGPTPMTEWARDRIGSVPQVIEQFGLSNMFFGFAPGSMAETSAFLCLLSLIYLLVRRVIKWIIPVTYLVTVFVLTYIIGAFNGYAATLDYALFGLLNGGLMFGAVFMATEPVTSPRTPNGKFIYALGIGVLTVLFRFKSRLPEGVASAILAMNLIAVIIDSVAAKLRVSANLKKVALTYSLIGLILVGVSAYTISGFVGKEVPQDETIELDSQNQNYNNFNFEYRFIVDDDTILVTTNQQYNIISIDNNAYNTDEYKALFSDIISKNRFLGYITSVDEDDTTLTVNVSTVGWSVIILSEVVFDNNNRIIDFRSLNAEDESYDDPYGPWDPANGHPGTVLPPKIITNQDNLDQIENISGATVTANAIILAAEVAIDYINYLTSFETLTITNKAQDYTTLNFFYVLRTGNEKVVVSTNQQFDILTISDNTYDNPTQRAIFTDLIDRNKIRDYISNVEVVGQDTVVTVRTIGYASVIVSVFTFDQDKNMTSAVTDVSQESYDYEYAPWKAESGRIETDLRDKIIQHEDDLSQVTPITGATVTSDAVIKAAKIAKAYMEAK